MREHYRMLYLGLYTALTAFFLMGMAVGTFQHDTEQGTFWMFAGLAVGAAYLGIVYVEYRLWRKAVRAEADR